MHKDAVPIILTTNSALLGSYFSLSEVIVNVKEYSYPIKLTSVEGETRSPGQFEDDYELFFGGSLLPEDSS